jgi:PAS domain S-box-containing protein
MNHPAVRRILEAVPVLLLTALLLAASPSARAVNPPQPMGGYAHTGWTLRDGYRLGPVFAMAQAPDGYLWMATKSGVARFDGEKFALWQPEGSKQPLFAYSLLLSRDGTVWFGTYDGLFSWDGSKLTAHAEIPRAFVTSLLEDRDGTVWVGFHTTPINLCEIRRGRTMCHGDDGALGNFVWSLAEDDDGAVWVGADTGLWRWRPGPPQRFALPSRVGDLVNSRDGLLVGLRDAGLEHFVAGKLEPYSIFRADKPGAPIPDAVVRSNKLLEDSEGGLWIGTGGVGLHHVKDGIADSFSAATGLTGDIACSVFEDREGNIWYSSEKGLDRFRKLSVTTRYIEQGPGSEVTRAVAATRDGSVWVAGAEGLSRWKNGTSSYYRSVPGLTVPGVQALFEDPRGRLWMGTYGGLAYFDKEKFTPVPGQPGNDVASMTGDEAGNLWLSVSAAIAHFKNDRFVDDVPWVVLGIGHRGSVLADRGGVWLGIWVEGGVLFVKDGKVLERHSTADGLGAGNVADLRLDRDGALWAATEGGLSRIKDGRVRNLTTENGLPCNTFYWSIEDDKRNLWLSASCGLVRVTRADLDAWLADSSHGLDPRRWGVADGLPLRPDTVNFGPPVTKAADGKLWFVSEQGIQIADPEHMKFNAIAPPVFVEQIVADRKPFRVTSDVRLPALVRDVTIEFSAVNLTDAHSGQFRYRLEGHDREWQEAGDRRQAFYTNLGPGTFRFFVKASNNNGVWNEKGAELVFSIAPAYYQTLWFRIACVLLLAALVAAGFLLHARRVRREEKRLRSVIEGLPTLAFSVYADGRLDLVNQRWLDYFGAAPGAQRLSAWRSALHPQDVETHLRKWEQALASGEPFENEARHRSVRGEYRWFLVRAVPLHDAAGKILRWYGTLTDIEERKRAEEERERLQRLEAQLSHTNRLSMLGELTASIAHEINQPIGAAIASAAAGLRWLDRDAPALEETRDALRRIKEDGKRAADIITGLKAFYLKDSSPQRAVLDVNEVIREMLVLLHREADRHHVVMRTELASGLPAVSANRVQLQQVLMNLMVNGIEAMKEAGGELVVSTRPVEGGLEVRVSDTGVGIPADKMDQIFNAFVSTKQGGTGLGLAISRTIIEAHEGELWAESRPGPGATFCFRLPAA